MIPDRGRQRAVRPSKTQWSPARWSGSRTSRRSSPSARLPTSRTPNSWPPRSPRCGGAAGRSWCCSGPACSAPPSCGGPWTGCQDQRAPGQGFLQADGQTGSPRQISWCRATPWGRRGCWRCWPPVGLWSHPLTGNRAAGHYPPARDWSTGQGTPAMAGALLRLLTAPALCHGMGCRAREAARQYHLQRIAAGGRRRE